MTDHIHGKGFKFDEPLLVAAVIVVLSYSATYLLAVSPVLIRALGPLFGS